MQHSGPPALDWHLLGPKTARFFNANRKYSRGNLRNLTAKRMRERSMRTPVKLYAFEGSVNQRQDSV
jgi:hypothetical protein